MKKKVISFMLSLAMVFTSIVTLSGCSNGGGIRFEVIQAFLLNDAEIKNISEMFDDFEQAHKEMMTNNTFANDELIEFASKIHVMDKIELELDSDTDYSKFADDIKSEYYILDEDRNIASNSLIDTTSIKVEKIANSDNINDTDPNTLYKEDKVSLMLLGGHDNSSWRVSMYCNHKLVKAFDGNEYIDLKADSDEMSTYTIPMSVINDVQEQYNSIYFIASPIGSDGENYPIKSHTFVYVNK